MNPADLTEAAVHPAAQLVAIVHGDGDQADVTRILQNRDRTELHALAVVLAAMVDPDKTVTELLDWTEWARRRRALENIQGLRPHGTHAAYVRHKANGTTPCDDCLLGEREYQAARKRARRAAQDAA